MLNSGTKIQLQPKPGEFEAADYANKRFRLRFDSTWRYSKSGYISGPIDPKFYKKQLRDVKVPLE